MEIDPTDKRWAYRDVLNHARKTGPEPRPSGPWDNEEDRYTWVDSFSGYRCLILRSPSGGLCGYVGVEQGHPWFCVGYDMIDDPYPDIHGGLTFAGAMRPYDEESMLEQAIGIYPVWWLGFDCNHVGDNAPFLPGANRGGVYRDVAYVRTEVTHLAAIAKEAEDQAAGASVCSTPEDGGST